jgi:hypothetical protein
MYKSVDFSSEESRKIIDGLDTHIKLLEQENRRGMIEGSLDVLDYFLTLMGVKNSETQKFSVDRMVASNGVLYNIVVEYKAGGVLQTSHFSIQKMESNSVYAYQNWRMPEKSEESRKI